MAVILAKVINLRGEERTRTLKAYEFMRKSDKLLGYVDENGNPVDGPAYEAGKKKEVVAPVEVKAKRGRPTTKVSE